MSVFRRILFVLLLVGVAIAVIVAAAYTGGNWRVRRTWENTRRELEAKGESLDWAHFIPPPAPDDQNLALAPLYVRLLAYRPDPKTGVYTFGPESERSAEFNGLVDLSQLSKGLKSGGWETATHTDLAGRAEALRRRPDAPPVGQTVDPSATVLAAFERYRQPLDELARAAAERPLCRFPVDWETANPYTLKLPHYQTQQILCSALRTRASARLAAGQSAAAADDIQLGLRLVHDLHGEPTLLSHLVAVISCGVLLNPIWEGLADRRWSAAELTRLQQSLQQNHFLADYQWVIRGERASAGVLGVDYASTHFGEWINSVSTIQWDDPKGAQTMIRWFGFAVPQAWFDYNKVVIARFVQEEILTVVDPANRRVYLDKEAEAKRELAAMEGDPAKLMARVFLPIYVDLIRRPARGQAGVEIATTACALERFFLDHRAYPAALAELVPAYLEQAPVDPIDGAPLRYAQTPDGRYRLYSIGWNGRDDGGTVAWRKTDGKVDDKQGDWVWQYEPMQPPGRD